MDGINETVEAGMIVKRRGRPPKEKVGENFVDVKFDDLGLMMAHWAYRLELAAAMRAGVMDSESKHLEVQNAIRDIVLSVAEELRSKC